MEKYTSIDRIHNMVRSVRKENARSSSYIEPVTFVGTVKLHGTNAGVRVNSDGTVVAQSRTRVLTTEKDNYGWAKFVEENSEVLKFIANTLFGLRNDDATIFGEWIGPGIQGKVAISKLPQRLFVIFGALIGDGEDAEYIPEDVFNGYGGDILSHDPAKTLADHNIFLIGQVPSYSVSIDFLSEKSIQDALEYTEKLAEDIGESCPFGAFLGVAGPGEGVVWKPIGKHAGDTRLFFKSKSEAHKNERDPRAKPTIDPVISEDIAAFVNFSVTTARLEQGVFELGKEGHEVDIRNMGKFIQWVNKDVLKECSAELEASGLEWKSVCKSVSALAKEHWQKELRKC